MLNKIFGPKKLMTDEEIKRRLLLDSRSVIQAVLFPDEEKWNSCIIIIWSILVWIFASLVCLILWL